jgi:glutamine amidotransferase
VIAVLDYGAGNLRSVENALAEVGAAYRLVHDAAGLRGAAQIILPGVGHFGQMMRALNQMQVRDALQERIAAGVPFLGICLGMQALFAGSEEAPEARGLALYEGTVRRFPPQARVPHMGWNTLSPLASSRLLDGLEARPYVYFAHSYYVPVTAITAATCTYTTTYTALIEAGNTFGVQFHPEKSGASGLRIIRNFAEL